MELKQNTLPGFEGVEKNLKIEFPTDSNIDCRRISRKSIDAVLTEARCTIIGSKSTRFFDSYVLSESSLFVYPHKIILKTCGTTRLLSCLSTLLQCAKEIGATPTRVLYSRCNFIFPNVQPAPHCNFEMEAAHLDQFFKGTPHILGPINGARWHLYSGDYAMDRVQHKLGSKEQVLEVAMFDLDREIMKKFYRESYASMDFKEFKDSNVDPRKLPGAVATHLSGISSLLPGFDIDYHLFDPCGYSCNGLKDQYYFTIHVTPEPECSFVSFETNVPVIEHPNLLARVLATFRPGRFCVLAMEDGFASPAWSFDGFSAVAVTQLKLSPTSTVTSCQYVQCNSREVTFSRETPFLYDCPSQDGVDSPSSDTDGEMKEEKSDKKKKKRKKRCRKKKKKMLTSSSIVFPLVV